MSSSLLDIYIAFFKMGAVTFGGGYAMLPILQREAVEKQKWVTNEEVMDFYAISQGLPGIIAVNVSVFIGYHLKKMAGGIAAALGVVSPCLVIITAIAAFLSNFQDNIYVRHAFAGISVCVVGLIVNAVIGLWKKSVKDILTLGIVLVVFAAMVFTNLSPIIFIVGSALIGILVKSSAAKKEQQGGVK